MSSFGRCLDSRGVISYGCRHSSGYYQVHITPSTFSVHRLVALAFLGRPPNEMAWQVHHRDGNPSNNHVDNLEWVTPSQNGHYSYQDPLRGTSGPLQGKPVRWRKLGCKDWIISGSIAEAADLAGVSRSTVSRCCMSCKPATNHDFLFAEQVGHLKGEDGEEWHAMLDPKSGVQVPHRMVSSMGRVTLQNGRVSRGCMMNNGYFRTQLSVGHKRRSEYIHRIVAFAFCGPPPSLLQNQVNHKDWDKDNNAVENLEWSSASRNVRHCWAGGRRKPTTYGKPVESRPQ